VLSRYPDHFGEKGLLKELSKRNEEDAELHLQWMQVGVFNDQETILNFQIHVSDLAIPF